MIRDRVSYLFEVTNKHKYVVLVVNFVLVNVVNFLAPKFNFIFLVYNINDSFNFKKLNTVFKIWKINIQLEWKARRLT